MRRIRPIAVSHFATIARFPGKKVRSVPSSRRGTVLVACIVMQATISVMLLGVLASLRLNAQTMRNIERHEQCYYIAEAGIQHGLSAIRNGRTPSIPIRWENSRTESSGYVVTVSTETDGRSVIRSTGYFDGASQLLEVALTQSHRSNVDESAGEPAIDSVSQGQ